MAHDLEFAWDDNWLRWQMDGVVLYEETKTASRSLFGSLSSVSVDFSMNAQHSGSFLQIQAIDLLKQNDSKDGDACRPRYPTDANCRDKTCT